MTRPIFGVTDSPREVERKRQAEERTARRERLAAEPTWAIERDAAGMPVRLWWVPGSRKRGERGP